MLLFSFERSGSGAKNGLSSPSSEAAAAPRSFFYSFSFEQSGSGAKKLSIVSSKETLQKKTNAPSLPAADAGLLAEQLGHDLAGGNVLRQRVDVVPVGRADVVGLLQEAVLFFFFGAEREKGGKISFYVLFDPLDTLPPSKKNFSFSFLPDHARRDRLLPGVEVHEAEHLAAVVHLGAHFLF